MLEVSVEPGFLEGTLAVPWTDELYHYGELPWAELVHIYRDTLNFVVFPGFQAVDIDTGKARAWLERRSSTREEGRGGS
jgi:hypothetical protein